MITLIRSLLCRWFGRCCPPPPPPSNGKIRLGVYLRSWTEIPETIGTLSDLKPAVVRTIVPYDIYSGVADAISTVYSKAKAIGALPLMITSLATKQGATPAEVVADAPTLAKFYATFAALHPGCAWEIGNEPEIASPSNLALDPKSYAAYFNALAAAIKAADPTATIVTGGTSGFHTAWIREMLALVKGADAVGVHPYGAVPYSYPALVAAIGASLPVWFTEYGTTARSAEDLQRYFDYARGAAAVAVWFCLSDLSADGGATFGLMSTSGAQRPTYSAAKAEFARVD